MTDEQIIKALECCIDGDSCDGCPLICDDVCTDNLRAYSLDLAKHQKSEIDGLKNIYKSPNYLGRLYNKIKSEAIKEFWEKAKEKQKWDVDIPNYVLVADGDNLLKEMEQSVNMVRT